jgi:hypothetical protein
MALNISKIVFEFRKTATTNLKAAGWLRGE